jgi:hypothetical protein
MSNLVLPHGVRRRMMKLASENFGPTASTLRVKVHYHSKHPDGTVSRSNWATMGHEEYFKWLIDAPAKGLVLESVEQIRHD